MIRHASCVCALLAAFVSSEARAAEVQVEGFYQARGRLFDTLSLDRDLDSSEGLSWFVQHRLWIRPKFWITDHVGLMVDVRALDNVYWGDSPFVDSVPFLDAPPALSLLSDTLDPPVSTTDARKNLVDISLWRAWGEVRTKVGTFKFGRMPLHWGLGIWQNDGLGINQEYGDSVDRIMWEHVISQVYMRVAADVNTEGLINQTDDTTSFNAAVAYRTERMEGGLNFQYRRQNADDAKFDLFTIDGAFDLEFGPVGLKGEVVGQFGNGDLAEFVEDSRIVAVGAVLDVGLELDRFKVNLEGGLATGDGTPNTDARITTFTFDRDYNVGLFMFEQPMPVLSAGVATEDNQGRSTDALLSGNAVSNALYLRPSGAYRIIPGLWAELSFLTARTAKVPDSYKDPDRRGYGYEFGLGMRYTGVDHFTLQGNFGVFVPGGYYRNYTDDENLFQGFRATAFGGQLIARVHF